MTCLPRIVLPVVRSVPLLLLFLLTSCKPVATFTGQSLLDDQGNEYGLLSWSITGKDSDQYQLSGVSIEPDIGAVDASGSLEVYPTTTTTYQLTVYATGPNNTVYNSVYHATIHIGPRVDYDQIQDTGLHQCLEKTGFTHLEQFDAIYCVGQNIHSLAGIEQFSMTQSVSLDNNRIGDLTPLASMPQLNVVSLSNNGLTGLDTLAGSTSIHNIVAFHNQIADVSALTAMPQLLNLSLDENLLTDADALAGLAQLQGLSLARNQITDVTPLGSLTGLLALDISDNGVASGIPALKTLTRASVIRSAGNNQVRCIDYANLILALGPVVIFDTCKLF